MVHGIGTDIMEADRILNPDVDVRDPFYRTVFTPGELAAAQASGDAHRYLAARFAGKEAVFKSFGIDGNHVRLIDIEILPERGDEAPVQLDGALGNWAAEEKITEIHLMLKWIGKRALAFAIAEKAA